MFDGQRYIGRRTAETRRQPARAGQLTDLAGWTADDHLAAFAAYQASCQVLHKIRRADDHRPIYRGLRNACRKAIGLRPQDSDTARTFFEQNFQPVRIARLGEVKGLLTSYFEPIVQGSRLPNREFRVSSLLSVAPKGILNVGSSNIGGVIHFARERTPMVSSFL